MTDAWVTRVEQIANRAVTLAGQCDTSPLRGDLEDLLTQARGHAHDTDDPRRLADVVERVEEALRAVRASTNRPERRRWWWWR